MLGLASVFKGTCVAKQNLMTKLVSNPFLRSGLFIVIAAGLASLLFPEFVQGIFRADQFMPHATCYLRNPKIIFLHVSSDLLIGSAYVCISTTQAYLVYKASRDIPFHWMFLAFGLFIITCGFTHFMEVWTVWQAVYWLAGYVKVLCAAASVATAIALFPLVPKVFALINAVKVSEDRRVKLEAANRELEGFAYSVAHDLRSPLRTIQGMAGALQEDCGPRMEATALQYTDRIRDASHRMDALIRDMLAYSQIIRTEADLGPVDLRAAFEEAQTHLAADVGQSGAEIQVHSAFPGVIGNRILLTQVLANLLSNAVKFVPAGVRPSVKVFTKEAGQTVRICVQDNGIGIAQEHREKIFRIFERLHSNTAYPGTGIGLAIVERAMQRMNGAVGCESTLGKGSCFWIELLKA